MVKCTSCLKKKEAVHRTKRKGQSDAGWMCVECIQKNNKEVANMIHNDAVMNDIINTIQEDGRSKSN